jgi:CubicO group peptidase (beta-lactamase class C family)
MQRREWAAGRLVSAVMVCAAVLVACSKSQPQAAPSRSSAAADRLPAAIADVMNSYATLGNVRAIIVNVDGRTRLERYFSSSADESRSIYSVTKSVTSTLVGIAISEGRLRLDESLSQMLPRYVPEMKPSVARVTLRQLLTMTGGFPDTNTTPREIQTPPDWVRYILTHQDTAPGAEFHYSDYGAHLLAPILVQATGESVLAYARTKLFDPLGIVTRPSVEPRLTAQTLPQALAAYAKAGFAWPIDPQGFHLTEALLKLRPRDMATFGQLFLQTGHWNGRQVVPAAWVAQASTAQAGKAFPGGEAGAFGPTNYGYFWWVQPAAGVTAYAAIGFGGQLVDVVPSLHLVIVVSSYVDETNPHPLVVDNDKLRRLVAAIVPIIKTQPRH